MTDAYKSCRLCPRGCGVDRTGQARGVCRMPAELTLARAALHHWEEPSISGQRGSGAIFFSGCPLGCIYCQNREIARGETGRRVEDARLDEIFWELAREGAHNINLVTATHYAPTVAEAISRVRAEGFSLPFVWNTSGYETKDTLRMLAGRIDIYLTDLRYDTSATAARYSHAADYPEIAWEALAEMVEQTGPCSYGEGGILLRGVVVRLLLLPGHVLEAKHTLYRLWQAYGDRITVSLMQQYTPMPEMPSPLDRRVTEAEYLSLVRYAQRLGMQNAFVQEREAAEESFIPPFDLTGV